MELSGAGSQWIGVVFNVCVPRAVGPKYPLCLVWTRQGIGAELKRLPLEPAGTLQYPRLEGAVGAENGS